MTVRITGIADVNRVLREIAPNEARNLLRATTAELAKGVAADARKNVPVDSGDLLRGIGHKRGRGARDRVVAHVIANSDGRSYYWRFREYGQGPDRREDAMFTKALMSAQSELAHRYLSVFTDKLIRRLARKRR